MLIYRQYWGDLVQALPAQSSALMGLLKEADAKISFGRLIEQFRDGLEMQLWLSRYWSVDKLGWICGWAGDEGITAWTTNKYDIYMFSLQL